MTGSIATDDRNAWPVPAPECKVCAALVVERDEAHGAGDRRTVAQVNTELRNHPHRKRRPTASVPW